MTDKSKNDDYLHNGQNKQYYSTDDNQTRRQNPTNRRITHSCNESFQQQITSIRTTAAASSIYGMYKPDARLHNVNPLQSVGAPSTKQC